MVILTNGGEKKLSSTTETKRQQKHCKFWNTPCEYFTKKFCQEESIPRVVHFDTCQRFCQCISDKADYFILAKLLDEIVLRIDVFGFRPGLSFGTRRIKLRLSSFSSVGSTCSLSKSFNICRIRSTRDIQKVKIRKGKSKVKAQSCRVREGPYEKAEFSEFGRSKDVLAVCLQNGRVDSKCEVRAVIRGSR